MAGRATVLTEEDELFGATVGEAGGTEAGFPLLAPLAPLAAPKQTDSKGVAFQEGGGGWEASMTLPIFSAVYPFWLP